MIRIDSLSKSYGPVQALRDVSLVVNRGEIFALLGPNGAGKSTLLKSLVGLVRPTRGAVAVAGIDLLRRPRAALSLIGFVPQQVAFPRHQTAREVLAFYAALKGVAADAVEQALARVGLLAAADRRVGELSGGTLQRLGLAQAILADPPLLVLDEPTVGLDPQIAAEFRDLLTALNAAGTTIVLTSHLLGEVERLAHRVAILKAGRILAVDAIPHLLSSSGLASALWLTPDADPEWARRLLRSVGVTAQQVGPSLRITAQNGDYVKAMDALRGAGTRIESFWTTTPTLDEVFRRIVGEEEQP